MFWDFLYHDCDNAGIWHVDIDIAQIYVGKDMPINPETALRVFNEGEERVKVLPGGKWFIIPFIPFQYGELTPINNMHRPIIATLIKLGVRSPSEAPRVGAMDMDKDKDKDQDKDKNRQNFQKPTPQEVNEYAVRIDFVLDGEAFCDYYEARGWQYKKGQPMKDWKAAVRTWRKNGFIGNTKNGNEKPDWQ